ncbi:hypothetical protein G6F68_014295 [Rhizopus microsporus]|nr:hypothetical protein G6F68_014295 [Rhizopus microsporus]
MRDLQRKCLLPCQIHPQYHLFHLHERSFTNIVYDDWLKKLGNLIENGGEFIDSVQNRVIKVDVDKLKEDGNRHAKRVSLKNARIRPKEYNTIQDQSIEATDTTENHSEEINQDELPADPTTAAVNNGWTAQSAVRTTAIQPPSSPPSQTQPKSHRVPSLNVARSCGDLDFKMDPQRSALR